MDIKNTHMTILLLCVIGISVHAIPPVQVLNAPEYETEEYRTNCNIYLMSFPDKTKSEIQQLIYYTFDYLTDYYFLGLLSSSNHQVLWNVKDQEVIEDISGNGRVVQGELIISASEAVVDGRWVSLENAYEPPTYDGVPSHKLVMAALSPDARYVGGAVSHQDHDRFDINERFSLYLWNAEDGKLIFNEPRGMNYWSESAVETYFSDTGRFLVMRSMSGARYYLSEGRERYSAYAGAKLLDVNQLRLLTADRDVAFSSDDRYFVTMRDGVPTLVEAATDRDRLRYEMPSPMLAAVFSPDDRKVYLAGEDNKIYVFESGLTAAAAGGWWELE
jgi:hypothetical protein